MTRSHPALVPGAVAVITGAASGIGLAAARRVAGLGMPVWMADRDAVRLETAAAEVRAGAPGVDVDVHRTDVSRVEEVEALAAAVHARHDAVALLMNNAGVGSGGGALGPREGWEMVLGVNLWGVIHGVQAFGPRMAAQATPGAIVNTGSKQGLTTPPGDTAYNVSKAGVKVLTEGLAHSLRNTDGCQVSAHLFVPGFVWTPLTAGARTEKPDGAWTPEQTVEHLFARLGEGDFYILCPDGETTPAMDEKRIAWAVGDILENRPALSRWHADWADRFAAHMARRP